MADEQQVPNYDARQVRNLVYKQAYDQILHKIVNKVADIAFAPAKRQTRHIWDQIVGRVGEKVRDQVRDPICEQIVAQGRKEASNVQ